MLLTDLIRKRFLSLAVSGHVCIVCGAEIQGHLVL